MMRFHIDLFPMFRFFSLRKRPKYEGYFRMMNHHSLEVFGGSSWLFSYWLTIEPTMINFFSRKLSSVPRGQLKMHAVFPRFEITAPKEASACKGVDDSL